jgi:hypothetical protein
MQRWAEHPRVNFLSTKADAMLNAEQPMPRRVSRLGKAGPNPVFVSLSLQL